MVRLIIKAQTAQEVVLAVHGNIAGSTVPLLKQAGEAHWHESQRLVLDLDEVPVIDEAGLALLQGWSGPQLQLRGGSPYLRAWLATEGLESENSTPTGTATTATTNRR